MSEIQLVQTVQQSFQIAKTYEQNKDRINSISFSDDGKLLVTTSDDDSINLYDCEEGSHLQTLHSKKYGAAHGRFTHGGRTIVHASSKVDNTVRYLSLHDNKYLRYFVGHKDKVTSLSMNPVSDQFISSSNDMSIRLWDLRSTNCSGVIQAPNHVRGTYGPKGVIFAVGVGGNMIKLYDARKYETGPFENFSPPELQDRGGADCFDDLQISPDSKSILTLRRGSAFIVDAFSGDVRSRKDGEITAACFSPCGTYFYTGNSRGLITCWKTQTGDVVSEHPDHDTPISALAFDPRLMLLASADTALNMWIPTV